MYHLSASKSSQQRTTDQVCGCQPVADLAVKPGIDWVIFPAYCTIIHTIVLVYCTALAWWDGFLCLVGYADTQLAFSGVYILYILYYTRYWISVLLVVVLGLCDCYCT